MRCACDTNSSPNIENEAPISRPEHVAGSKTLCTSVYVLKALSHCNFSCNLQRNSALKKCKLVTNVWYVKNILANCDGNLYLPILHLPRVELHCKLQEKLHRVTGPLSKYLNLSLKILKTIQDFWGLLFRAFIAF